LHALQLEGRTTSFWAVLARFVMYCKCRFTRRSKKQTVTRRRCPQ